MRTHVKIEHNCWAWGRSLNSTSTASTLDVGFNSLFPPPPFVLATPPLLPTMDFKATCAPPLSRDVGRIVWTRRRDTGGRISRGDPESGRPEQYAMKMGHDFHCGSFLSFSLPYPHWPSLSTSTAGIASATSTRQGPPHDATQRQGGQPNYDVYSPNSTIRAQRRKLGPDDDIYSLSTMFTAQQQQLRPIDDVWGPNTMCTAQMRGLQYNHND